MASLGEMLTFLRKRSGMSQKELANKLNLSRSTIGMYETGQREPEIELLKKMAQIYGVSLNTITGVGFPDINGDFDDTASPAKLLRFDTIMRGDTSDSEWSESLYGQPFATQKKQHPANGEALVSELPEDIQNLIAICKNNPALTSALLAVARQIETRPSAQE